MRPRCAATLPAAPSEALPPARPLPATAGGLPRNGKLTFGGGWGGGWRGAVAWGGRGESEAGAARGGPPRPPPSPRRRLFVTSYFQLRSLDAQARLLDDTVGGLR